MNKRNCKDCIWLDICLNKTETDEACEDYFTDEEDNLVRHLTNQRREYQKEWDIYVQDAD